MAPAPSPSLQVIGKRLPRVDAKERVTSQAVTRPTWRCRHGAAKLARPRAGASVSTPRAPKR
jgi:hypothetical protein